MDYLDLYPNCQYCGAGFFEDNCQEAYDAAWVGLMEPVTDLTAERRNPFGY